MADQGVNRPQPRKRKSQTIPHASQPERRASMKKPFTPRAKVDSSVAQTIKEKGHKTKQRSTSARNHSSRKSIETPRSSRATRGNTSASAKSNVGSQMNMSSKRSRSFEQPKRSASVGESYFAQNVWTKKSKSSSRDKDSSDSTEGVLARFFEILKRFGVMALHALMALGAFIFSFFNRSRKTRIIGIVLVVLLVGGIGDTLINMGKIYPGVKVGTVDVGGKTQNEAAQILNDTYQARVSSNTAVFYANEEAKNNPTTTDSIATIDEQVSYEESLANRSQWTTPSSELGAQFDANASAEAAFQVGRDNGGVFSRFACLLFGSTIDPLCSYNEDLLEALRYSISTSVGNPRINFGIQMNGSTAEVTDGHDGEEVSDDWFRSTLNKTYCGEDASASYVVKIEHAPLQITKSMAQETADIINNSISQGASFVYEGASWMASRDDLARWITTSIVEEKGSFQLKPSFNQDITKNSLLNKTSEQVRSEALQVSFSVSDSKDVKVTSNTKGNVPEVSEAVTSMNDTFFTKETRTQVPEINIPSIAIPDEMSFDEAISFGIIGEISSFTTQFSSGAEARNHNIRTVCGYLTNSIAKANGGTWSFNDTAGETTEALGYKNAGAIVDGEYTDEIGGGVCQVATTVYNAVYDAGYPIVERHNHTLYIASYPEGRDAAIAFPYYDLVWENDTSSDILLVMSYTNSSVTATLYGVDPGYSVSTQYGEWKAGEKYKTKYKDDDTLPAGTEKLSTSGEDGREITVVRTVKDSQGNVRSEQTFTSVYDPKDEVILKGTA